MEIETLENLTEKLSEFGDVQVIKDDYVFTLLITSSVLDLTKHRRQFKILDLVTDYTDKENIEVMRSEFNFVLVVLKP